MKKAIIALTLISSVALATTSKYIVREQNNAEAFTCSRVSSAPTRVQAFDCVSNLDGSKYTEIVFLRGTVLVKEVTK